jgi:hypothetical protein
LLPLLPHLSPGRLLLSLLLAAATLVLLLLLSKAQCARCLVF